MKAIHAILILRDGKNGNKGMNVLFLNTETAYCVC